MRNAAEPTLGDIVTDNAIRHAGVEAYRHGERVLTHEGLRDRAVRLVSALVDAGVARQDRVAILSRNAIEFGEVLAATQLSGIILATVNFRSSPPEVLDVLNRVRPSVVFVADEFAGQLTELVPRLDRTPLNVRIGGPGPTDLVDYEEFVGSGSAAELRLRARADDIACLLFTSGTTGPSKCCIMGQRELRRVVYAMNAELATGSRDRALVIMPMFHFGAIGIIGGVHARGGTVVLQTQFDVPQAIRLIVAERISVLHFAPVMLRALLQELTRADPLAADSVRTVVYSAAPMTVDTLQRAMAVMPHAGFLNLYGQTEAIVSGLPRELHDPDAPMDRLRSVGFPLPGVRVRIVGDDGRDVDVGSPGEIAVWSDCMFRGYWDDPAATGATLRDGWCYTGDVGCFDEAGLLYLIDRKKDVVITGGENVYSPEVEAAISVLPEVTGCAVIGVPDERWGEAVCAVVATRADRELTLETLQAAVRSRLAGYKVPRRMVVVTDLPVLASGKVDKKRLRNELAAGHLQVGWP